MTYIRVIWKHQNRSVPVLLYSELDDNRQEIRKVEIFADGHRGFAELGVAVGGTALGKVPIPPISNIADDPQFEPAEITAAEFEEAWAKRYSFKGGLSKFITIGLITAGLLFFSLFLYLSKHSQQKTPFSDSPPYYTSTSPDGQYICVIIETKPPVLMDSPYLYSLGIIEAKGHAIENMPGKSLEINNDSCTLNIKDIIWDVYGATVVENTGRPIASVSFRNSEQHWTNLRQASTTTTTIASE